MIKVNVNGVVHQVATLAEARALSGVKPAAPKRGYLGGDATWMAETNGKCNRCQGTGVFGGLCRSGDGPVYGAGGIGGAEVTDASRCLRCKGTGVAPGYKDVVEVTPMCCPVCNWPTLGGPCNLHY